MKVETEQGQHQTSCGNEIYVYWDNGALQSAQRQMTLEGGTVSIKFIIRKKATEVRLSSRGLYQNKNLQEVINGS